MLTISKVFPRQVFKMWLVWRQWGYARDTSTTTVWTGSVDLTGQLDEYLQAKTGLEYIYSEYNIRRGRDSFLPYNNNTYRWTRTPVQCAAYAQAKFEFEGLITQPGVRLDYFDPTGRWYSYDPYTRAFTATNGRDQLDEMLEQSPTEAQVAFSPRLGLSFPVTQNSKLFLNYGRGIEQKYERTSARRFPLG